MRREDVRLLVLLPVLVWGACGGDAGPPETASTPATLPEGPPAVTATTSTIGVPEELAGFPVTTVEVDGDLWRVAVAATPERRRRGLMGVGDLGGLDGMLFEFEGETTGRFWMKDTLIPLDIAFFDRRGRLVDVLRMEPCRGDPCPTYGPERPYRWALEAPAGELAGLAPDAELAVPEG